MSLWIQFGLLMRSLIGVFLFGILTFVLSVLAISVLMVKRDRIYINFITYLWGKGTLIIFGVTLREINRNNIPDRKKGGVFIFNHTSFMDIFSLAAALPDLNFGAKLSLFQIPIFGYAMKLAGVLPISRNNIKSSIQAYQSAENKAIRGQRYAIAPEGQRQKPSVKTGKIQSLLPFKKGPFIFAIKTQVPIIPVIIRGSELVWPVGKLTPNWSRKKCIIKIEYLPAINTKGWKLEDKESLIKKTYSLMNDRYELS